MVLESKYTEQCVFYHSCIIGEIYWKSEILLLLYEELSVYSSSDKLKKILLNDFSLSQEIHSSKTMQSGKTHKKLFRIFFFEK